jgi:cytoskeletal protein RodZ
MTPTSRSSAQKNSTADTKESNVMDQQSSRRESRRAFRWMVVFLVALVLGAVGWLSFSKAWDH